ncbi:transglycosylase domain-containing protein [Providencia rustigianii]|uniref:transglycosylase domain-containing protein n=1 Tax=Providencia rustigianii TaxID=158850 RepID=UPI000D87806E|nr:biosynthetic peptidoglycan transglycosylase [Providencia rustigianii]SPY77457.1 Penicillin-binding protein 1A [Providencia rustigianii]
MLSKLNLRYIYTTLVRAKKSIHNHLIKINIDLYHIEKKFNECRYVSHEYVDLHFHVIAIEDRRFFYHYGVDIISIIKNLLLMCTFQNHGGSSTIEMQLVRTITNYREITISRKIKEMILAVAINRRYTKLKIINSYLNYAYFGAHMNGIHDAISYMYNKYNIEHLSPFESSMIAAMLQQPRPKKSSLKRELTLINRAVHTQRRAINIKDSFYKSNITRKW